MELYYLRLDDKRVEKIKVVRGERVDLKKTMLDSRLKVRLHDCKNKVCPDAAEAR